MGRYFCVLAGRGLGSLTRYLLGRVIVHRFPNAQFALGTLSINVTGSFLIGLLMTLLVEPWKVSSPYLDLSIVIGFLGGYTTLLSNFEYDAYLSARAGNHLTALLSLNRKRNDRLRRCLSGGLAGGEKMNANSGVAVAERWNACWKQA